ncbi:MAG: hypothetical protein Q4B26_21065, partial [Eubacteriales bacterium]|nr:hypothetical protein [Eubacteriales bacterium]
TYFYHPTWYIVSTCCLAAGTFLIWLGVFYWLASPKFKVLFERLIWIFCISALVGYMFFGTDLGIISASLQYDNGMDFTWKEQLINLAVLGLLAGILLFAAFKWQHIIIPVMLSVCIALGGMAAWNIGNIQKSIAVLASFQDTDEFPHIELSKHDKNVVVIMLDRAMGEYVPYILKEKPHLKSQFAGFTYYDNTISFGSHTNFGTPPLYGGYEYTPVEMNKRDKELLADKHNEALRVMPVVFWENGYDVTVCEQPYANYQYVTDFSIYDDYPEINTFYTFGKFADPRVKQAVISQTRRNFFCFSIMKTLPLFLQETVYDEGRYLQAATAEIPRSIGQTIHSLSTATGTNATFMEQYHMLDHLPAITSASEEKGDTFYLMSNEITHSRMLLQTPNYIPSDNVDNTAYDASHTSRFTVDGKTLKMETEKQMSSYHANMAAFLNLGRWMEHLRDLGIYDNTKIILVADHGFALGQIEQWPTTVSPESPTETRGVEAYYPLLMVKDFNSQKFEISHEFMTNADVPTLA